MLNWFRKKKPGAENVNLEIETGRPAQTYRERVDAFWNWWSNESERILSSVDDDRGSTIQPEISAAVDQLGATFGWVFGPGENGARHSFTLSPEACPSCRYLANYWLKNAPNLVGWNFYSSRQPSTDFGGSAIRIGDIELKAESLWITPKVDHDGEAIDITVWSPLFADIPKNQAMQVLFLYLDEALGEENTSRCIGVIELSDEQLAQSFPLTELPEFVERTFSENEWSREHLGSVYQIETPAGDFPRGDIYVGSTEHMKLIGDFANNHGPIENPIAGSGAEFVFLQFPQAVVNDGSETDDRGKIEDGIESFLSHEYGHILGGATGTDAIYIDLLLFDGQNSRDLISQSMKEQGLADQYQIFSFVK